MEVYVAYKVHMIHLSRMLTGCFGNHLSDTLEICFEIHRQDGYWKVNEIEGMSAVFGRWSHTYKLKTRVDISLVNVIIQGII